MRFIVTILILILNLYNYEHSINSCLFLVLHICLYGSLFIIERDKSKIFIIFECMIISWPISWINIFGKSTEVLQLPWFYIWGAILAIFLGSLRKKKNKLYGNKSVILMYLFLMVYSLIPLLNAKDISNGMGDFIMIIFYIVILFFAYTSTYRMKYEEMEELKTVFIFVNLISAIGIIFQYILFKYYGVILFKIGQSGSFNGGLQISCSLLFEDTSCSTIMLGCGALYSVIRAMKEKKGIYYIIAIVITIGLTLTSRRTSVLTLILVLIPYFAFAKQKNNIKKILFILILPVIISGILYFLNLSRPVNDYSQYTNDTGRIVDYISAIEVAIHNPIGIGYGDTYLSSLMTSHIIPHNTILRWLDIGGILFVIPVINILFNILITAKKKNNISDFWVLIYVFIASNFIPDILNSRFLILICLFVLLKEDKGGLDEKENYDFYSNI